MDFLLVWGQFAAFALLVCVAGYFLSKYGDVLADRTGWGGNWVGLVLLATITSLPELITGVSAVSVANSPDIGVGEVMGSCVLNLFIIGLLDFMRPQPILRRVSPAHVLSAAFGILLIGFAAFAILLGPSFPYGIGHIGWPSFLIPAIYFVAIATIFRFEREESSQILRETSKVDKAEPAADPRGENISLRAAVIYCAISAAVVIGAALYLPVTAMNVVELMGWNEAFVGTLFVAIVTSLPELVVTVSAIRFGAYDMAIGNVLGSNLFNILILPFEDVAFLSGSLFAATIPIHAITGLSAVLMSAAVIIGILHRPAKPWHPVFNRVTPVSLFLVLIFLVNIVLVFGV